MPQRQLDIENIGRIGQMFLDGDALEQILANPFTCDDDDTDYNIPAFNSLKTALMKIERMNPDLYITGAIWYWYTANRCMATPVMSGKAHPSVGWIISPCDDSLYETLTKDVNTTIVLNGKTVHYFPVKTSDGRVVGALGLTEGDKPGPYEFRYDNRPPV